MSVENARALIVEDERSWQQILSEILTDAGLVVDLADNLDMALTYLRVHPHRLAVVDLSLEGDDPHNEEGLRVLEALGRHDPGCTKVLLTGYATVELAVSALTDYAAYTCLRKEAFNRSQFRGMVERVLANQASTAPGPGAADEPDGPEDQDARQASAGSALVVEDDAGWRSILFELLVDSGYQVRLCTSFGEALGCLRREKYQLAVVDLSLTGGRANVAPGTGMTQWEQSASADQLEGYRLLASTRGNGIPTIVVSGMANPSEIEKTYREQGIFAFMEKQSFDRRSFLNTVQEARRMSHARSELDILTDREREVLELLAQGMTNKEIAEMLFISTNTVKRHIKAIFEKLDIHTRSAAAAKALVASSGTVGVEG
ncbi:MAG: response regulator [Anaerolineaceae bacterium]|nr:response regulator [Anaerolineaceae bacterium]